METISDSSNQISIASADKIHDRIYVLNRISNQTQQVRGSVAYRIVRVKAASACRHSRRHADRNPLHAPDAFSSPLVSAKILHRLWRNIFLRHFRKEEKFGNEILRISVCNGTVCPRFYFNELVEKKILVIMRNVHGTIGVVR